MPKTLYGSIPDNLDIGGTILEPDAPQGVKLVPDNRTLIALPFNDDHDEDVEPVRLLNMKAIFEQYQPNCEVSFDSVGEGESEDLVLKFNNLKDFSKEGIIGQSRVLQELQEQEGIYSRLLDVLQNNNLLRTVLAEEDSKKEFLELIETLIEELQEN